MRYVLLIYNDLEKFAWWAKVTPAEIAATWPGFVTEDGRMFEHDRIEVRPIATR